MKRKILSFALAFIMIFAVLVPALTVSAANSIGDPQTWPQGDATPGTITVKNPSARTSIIDKTFTAYRVFDLVSFNQGTDSTEGVPTYYYVLTEPFEGLKTNPTYWNAFKAEYLAENNTFTVDADIRTALEGNAAALAALSPAVQEILAASTGIASEGNVNNIYIPSEPLRNLANFEEFLKFVKAYRLLDPNGAYAANPYDDNGYDYWEEQGIVYDEADAPGQPERRFNNDDWGIALTRQIQNYIDNTTNAAAIAAYNDANPTAPVSYTKKASAETVVFDNLEFGYYFIAGKVSATDACYGGDLCPEGEPLSTTPHNHSTITAVSALVTNDIDIVITIKTDAPTIDKEVWNQHEAFTKKEWQKWTDECIGDTVDYRLPSFVPDTNGYNRYIYKIHDTMSSGLTFLPETVVITVNGDTYRVADIVVDTVVTVPSTIKVVEVGGGSTVYADLAELEFFEDYDIIVIVNSADDLADPENVLADGCKFEILFKDDFMINYYKAGNVGKEIFVYYSAIINDAAVVGLPGNSNAVKLEYSNDSYHTDDENTEKTPDHEVLVFTGEFEIEKWSDLVDYNGIVQRKRLEGAEFELYRNYETDDDDDNHAENPVVLVYEGIADDGAAVYRIATSEEIAAGTVVVRNPAKGSAYNIEEGDLCTVVRTPVGGIIRIKGLGASYIVNEALDGTITSSTVYDDFGDYYLKETLAPDGFNPIVDGDGEPAEIHFTLVFDRATINAIKNMTPAELRAFKASLDDDYNFKNYWWIFFKNPIDDGNYFKDLWVSVFNQGGVRFPETGGIGRVIFYVVGGLLTVGTAFGLLIYVTVSSTKKKQTAARQTA